MVPDEREKSPSQALGFEFKDYLSRIMDHAERQEKAKLPSVGGKRSFQEVTQPQQDGEIGEEKAAHKVQKTEAISENSSSLASSVGSKAQDLRPSTHGSTQPSMHMQSFKSTTQPSCGAQNCMDS